MAVREIPKSFEYTCDICGMEHLQENASGHYTDSRPPHWSRLTLARDAYDYQGCAGADATVKLLLCEKCSERAVAAINGLDK
jgi:hypothetical protein